MAKRKHKKKSNKRKHSKQQSINYKVLNSILVVIIVLILAIVFILYTTDTKKLKASNEITKKIEKTIKQEITKVEKKSKKELDKYFKKVEIKKDEFEEYTKDLYEEYIQEDDNTKTTDIIKEDKQETKKDDIKTSKIEEPTKKEDKKSEEIQIVKPIIKPIKKIKDKPLPTLSNKPKLSIVIDDVTTQRQINQINNIGYITTMSFMPPTPNHPNSAKITRNLPFYMIHFPLEASTFRGEEKNTLHINDSYEVIEKRVAKVRELYPNAKYTNNHTGSKFTQHERSMDYFFRALVKYDFIFVDSRTTAKTVAKKMAKKYGMSYIARNVFLDNEKDFNYIQNQLKKAIKIAKKTGQAIAICHPYPITMKVLRESKHLLKDLELVYLNQLPITKK